MLGRLIDLVLVGVLVIMCNNVCVGGQVIRFGSCPDIDVKQNFTLEPYFGRWYEQQRYFALFELGLSCVTADYNLLPDGTIKVNNTGQKRNGKITTSVGTGYVPDPAVPAKLLVKFPGKEPAGNMWIIDTDYETFSIAYSCTNLGPFRLTCAWLLSRDPEGFPHASMEKIERILRKHKINKRQFQPTDQSSCIRENPIKTWYTKF